MMKPNTEKEASKEEEMPDSVVSTAIQSCIASKTEEDDSEVGYLGTTFISEDWGPDSLDSDSNADLNSWNNDLKKGYDGVEEHLPSDEMIPSTIHQKKQAFSNDFLLSDPKEPNKNDDEVATWGNRIIRNDLKVFNEVWDEKIGKTHEFGIESNHGDGKNMDVARSVLNQKKTNEICNDLIYWDVEDVSNDNNNLDCLLDFSDADLAKIGSKKDDADCESWGDEDSSLMNVSTEEIAKKTINLCKDFGDFDENGETNVKSDVISISSGSSDEVVVLGDQKPKSMKLNEVVKIANDEPSKKKMKLTHSEHKSDDVWDLVVEHDEKEDGLAVMKKIDDHAFVRSHSSNATNLCFECCVHENCEKNTNW